MGKKKLWYLFISSSLNGYCLFHSDPITAGSSHPGTDLTSLFRVFPSLKNQYYRQIKSSVGIASLRVPKNWTRLKEYKNRTQNHMVIQSHCCQRSAAWTMTQGKPNWVPARTKLKERDDICPPGDRSDAQYLRMPARKTTPTWNKDPTTEAFPTRAPCTRREAGLLRSPRHSRVSECCQGSKGQDKEKAILITTCIFSCAWNCWSPPNQTLTSQH